MPRPARAAPAPASPSSSSSSSATASTPSTSSSVSTRSSSRSSTSSSASSTATASTAPPPHAATEEAVAKSHSPSPVAARVEKAPTTDTRSPSRVRRRLTGSKTPEASSLNTAVSGATSTRRLRGTDRRADVRDRLRGAARVPLEVEPALESRLAQLTQALVAREEAAGAPLGRRGAEESAPSHSSQHQPTSRSSKSARRASTGAGNDGEDIFYVWLDGFKTAVPRSSSQLCVQQFLAALRGRSDAHGTSPVLLFDCTAGVCRRRARHQLMAEVDAALVRTSTALLAARRAVELCRSRSRRAQLASTQAAVAVTAAAGTDERGASRTPSRLTVPPVALAADRNEPVLDDALFERRGTKRKRAAANGPDAGAPSSSPPPTAPGTAAAPRQTLEDTRDAVRRLRAEQHSLKQQSQLIHRQSWLTDDSPEQAVEALLSSPEGILLLPHPETGMVRLEQGHHYRLVKFVGAHLVLAGHWEPIPLALADRTGLDINAGSPSARTTTAGGAGGGQSPMLQLAPTTLGGGAAGVREGAEPAGQTTQAPPAPEANAADHAHWARRELAAVLLFLRDNPERAASDFFTLSPEEAAIYVTAAAEKGWATGKGV